MTTSPAKDSSCPPRSRRARLEPALLTLLLLFSSVAASSAEDGYDLWLRYPPIGDPEAVEAGREVFARLVVEGEPTPTRRVIAEELGRGLEGLLGQRPTLLEDSSREGTLVVVSDTDSALIRGPGWREELERLGPEGFVIRRAPGAGVGRTVIASAGERGALYGAFHLLRLLGQGRPPDALDSSQSPRIERRLLNHWDNLDGTIERGYAGPSLWEWDELPARIDPRLADYGRANASLGINGAVLNNVNADPRALESAHLRKVAAVAEALRPYGLRVYLSANFSCPAVIGGLPTSDPDDLRVAAWWRDKAAEIYSLIPDFGGFLVKANSEGQPGPQDFGRTHAEGANVLARALEPYGGVVFWRAFVYDAHVDADRIKRSYMEFVPLNGELRENVFVQAKNGPLDFQPREPFHPLFGALPATPLAAELQITQEYLGQATHLVYLAPLWKEFLDADTYARGEGSTVSKVVDGSLFGLESAIAGVANIGSDRNWTGHPFAQANWYAFGRLAWDPGLASEAIAEEWIRQTWSRDPEVVASIRELMMGSRETYVRYTMPLGLHHLIGGDHYAPMPENPDPRRADWSAVYYHRADATGIGVDRTASGTGALEQYREPWRALWGDPSTCPENLLLWFHRLPWDWKTRSGRTLWEEIVAQYDRGASEAARMVERWESLKGRIDSERFAVVLDRLEAQASDAAAWRDRCVAYFDGRRTASPSAESGARDR